MRAFLPIYGHNQWTIIRLYDACGRSNERPYGLVRIACGLVRGRHKARPLQLAMVWCGRSNERHYGLARIVCGLVRGRHKARPLQLMWIYGLSVVGMCDDCAVVCRRTLMYIMRVIALMIEVVRWLKHHTQGQINRFFKLLLSA